jgi:pimeloyl-ACP methyl ester carboxylesterase
MGNNAEFWINPNWPGVGGDPHAVEMVRAGYDVWLGNIRGSKYGLVNDFWENDSHEFWDFSYYEQGLYDIPAQGKYIYDLTGGRKVSMFGYSMGTTSLMTSMAERPEFHEKHTNVVGLQAPCGTMNENLTEGIWTKEIYEFFYREGIYNLGTGPNWERD